MPPRPNAAQVRRSLDRLRALRGDPIQQANFAAELLEAAPGDEVLLPALEILAEHPQPAVHDALVRLYHSRDDSKRDRGGFLRAAILRALRHVALPSDAPLLERAVSTVEPTPQDHAGGSSLRVEALIAMADLDPELAGYHAAARLAAANDPSSTSTMTGEPAATAARVLGVLGQPLPLLVALQGIPRLHPEVAATCLAELRDVPAAVLQPLLEDVLQDARESVQLGLCDLLVRHQPSPPVLHAARAFLRATATPDLYRYFVASAVAEHNNELLAIIAEAATEEFNRDRLAILREQLIVRRADPAVAEALATIESRLAAAG